MKEDFKSSLFIVAAVHYIFDKNITSSFSNSVKLFKDKEEKMATFFWVLKDCGATIVSSFFSCILPTARMKLVFAVHKWLGSWNCHIKHCLG